MAGVEYSASPRAAAAPFMPSVVALAAATAKTVLQVGVPSTTDIQVLGWGVSFDGASGTATPVIVQLMDGDVAGTVTALTPELWGNSLQAASLCVGGTAATGYSCTSEGTLTTARVYDQQHVHPQAGYGVWFLESARPRVAGSRFLRVRCQAPAAVNCIPWVVWSEPAV